MLMHVATAGNAEQQVRVQLCIHTRFASSRSDYNYLAIHIVLII